MKKYVEMLRKMEKKKKIILAVLAVVIVAGAAAGGFFLVNGSSDSSEAQAAEKSNEFYNDLKDKVVADAPDPYDVKIDFASLAEVNPDIYAWIKVPGTNIDYPVLQNAELPDDYYLNHTIEKEATLPGSIYTEKYNVTGFTDPVTVMYGHTLKDGTMFSELKKYRDKEFFDENPYIYVYVPAGRFKYQIFAAVAFDDRYILGSYAFQEQADFESYITEIKSCMDGNINSDIAIDSRVLTLSTCIDESPNQRWLVNAVLVEEEWY